MRILVGVCILPMIAIITFPKLSLANEAFLEFYCYRNPSEKMETGELCDATFSDRFCDPQFTICLGDLPASCRLLDRTTEVFADRRTLCGNDRGSLSNPFRIALPRPTPGRFYLSVEIWDIDRYTSHDFIGKFQGNLTVNTTANNQPVRYSQFPLRRTNPSPDNSDLSLKMNFGIVCSENYYGRWCERECQPVPGRYSCSEEGTKVCSQGYLGQNCDHTDFCYFETCAPGATCRNEASRRVCICRDGTSGPHCYPDYNPCDHSPCRNQGNCSISGENNTTAICSCLPQWTGRFCSERVNPCQLNPCQNNSTCLVTPDYTQTMCVCLNGWDGDRCQNRQLPPIFSNDTDFNSTIVPIEQERYTRPIPNEVIMIGAAILGVCLLAAAATILVLCTRIRREKPEKLNEIEMDADHQNRDSGMPPNFGNRVYESVNLYDQLGQPYVAMNQLDAPYDQPDNFERYVNSEVFSEPDQHSDVPPEMTETADEEQPPPLPERNEQRKTIIFTRAKP